MKNFVALESEMLQSSQTACDSMLEYIKCIDAAGDIQSFAEEHIPFEDSEMHIPAPPQYESYDKFIAVRSCSFLQLPTHLF